MKIALVEDDTLTRERLLQLLASRLPLSELVAFGRKSTALAHAKIASPDYWLIDLGLPDGSGIDVIRTVRSLHPHTHILVISVFGDVDKVIASIQAGANGYLLKDAAQQDLAGAIAAMEHGGTPLSPMIASRLLETMDFAPTAPRAAAYQAVPASTHPAPLPQLTPKECELLNVLSRGYTYVEAAERLQVARSTIQTHVKNIYNKLAVNSKAEAVFEAKALGLLS